MLLRRVPMLSTHIIQRGMPLLRYCYTDDDMMFAAERHTPPRASRRHQYAFDFVTPLPPTFFIPMPPASRHQLTTSLTLCFISSPPYAAICLIAHYVADALSRC